MYPFVTNRKTNDNVPLALSPHFSTVESSEPASASRVVDGEKAKEKEASSTKEKAKGKEQNTNKQNWEGSAKLDEQNLSTKTDNQSKFVHNKSEFNRLLSYQNWPESCPVEPRDCAKAGFFYTGKEDIVQCFACFGKISSFKRGEEPLVKHNTYFPSCPFIQKLDVGNQPIPLVQEASAPQAMRYKEQSLLGHAGNPRKPNRKRVYANVRHPQFASEQARLESFAQCPQAVAIAPGQLARAGFLYTGSNDSCKCFNCDGVLKNWELKDDPWMEHARYFPNCEWLLQQKGQIYVNDVLYNCPPPHESAEVVSTAGSSRKKYRGGDDASEDEAGTFQTAQMAVVGGSGADPAAEREQEVGVARTTSAGSTGLAPADKPSAEDDTRGEENSTTELCGTKDDDNGQLHNVNLVVYSRGNAATFKKRAEAMEPSSILFSVLEIKLEMEPIRNIQLCNICMDKDISNVFLPCNHTVACDECAQAANQCPVCSKEIRNVVHFTSNSTKCAAESAETQGSNSNPEIRVNRRYPKRNRRAPDKLNL